MMYTPEFHVFPCFTHHPFEWERWLSSVWDPAFKSDQDGRSYPKGLDKKQNIQKDIWQREKQF